MSTQTEVTLQKAAKKHRCSWCAEGIEIGEQYSRWRYFSSGDVGTVKMHPECYGAMQVEAAREGGWLEWCPGDFERPVAA